MYHYSSNYSIAKDSFDMASSYITNEICRAIDDPKMFCGLPGLKDLYLGDNQLKSIDFEFDCIKKLRYLDLQYNKMKRLDQQTMKRIDHKFGGNKGMQITLIQNP